MPALDFDVGNIVIGLVFSGVGFIAFRYGKNAGKMNAMIVGGALMVYPYFTPTAVITALVGAGLTTLLFVWRD